jgi:hypothetical protein
MTKLRDFALAALRHDRCRGCAAAEPPAHGRLIDGNIE